MSRAADQTGSVQDSRKVATCRHELLECLLLQYREWHRDPSLVHHLQTVARPRDRRPRNTAQLQNADTDVVATIRKPLRYDWDKTKVYVLVSTGMSSGPPDYAMPLLYTFITLFIVAWLTAAVGGLILINTLRKQW